MDITNSTVRRRQSGGRKYTIPTFAVNGVQITRTMSDYSSMQETSIGGIIKRFAMAGRIEKKIGAKLNNLQKSSVNTNYRNQ